MASIIVLALQPGKVVVLTCFNEELCNTRFADASGKVCILDEMGHISFISLVRIWRSLTLYSGSNALVYFKTYWDGWKPLCWGGKGQKQLFSWLTIMNSSGINSESSLAVDKAHKNYLLNFSTVRPSNRFKLAKITACAYCQCFRPCDSQEASIVYLSCPRYQLQRMSYRQPEGQ